MPIKKTIKKPIKSTRKIVKRTVASKSSSTKKPVKRVSAKEKELKRKQALSKKISTGLKRSNERKQISNSLKLARAQFSGGIVKINKIDSNIIQTLHSILN